MQSVSVYIDAEEKISLFELRRQVMVNGILVIDFMHYTYNVVEPLFT